MVDDHGQVASHAKFAVGTLVEHKLFGYRGVVFDVNATFELDDEWYDQVARSRPPKDAPWYHVLVDESERVTYVAERNLEVSGAAQPIRHPLLRLFFSAFRDGRYQTRQRIN